MNTQDPTYNLLALSIQKGFVNTVKQPLARLDAAVKAQNIKNQIKVHTPTKQVRSK